MTSKERMVRALDLELPDRLPVTTHHVLPSYLEKYHQKMDSQEFYRYFGFDPILYYNPVKVDSAECRKVHIPGAALPIELSDDISEPEVIISDQWDMTVRMVQEQTCQTWKAAIYTPKGTLTSVLQSNRQNAWIVEPLVKKQSDMDLVIEYAPMYSADVEALNSAADAYGEIGLVRGVVPGFELFGQPGCWQDLACLYGIEKLIYATFDDPNWVHSALSFLRDRKLHYIQSLQGAKYDLLALGGGDASTTVISPTIFREFVAPYDFPLIEAAKAVGIRVVYHVCGGMMPILEDIADMGPTAIETLTPPFMGGDADLKEIKRRIGQRVCLIGGIDQGNFFIKASPDKTRDAVRRAFDEAGGNGGFIISPSDHFFDAKDELLEAFVAEAHACIYR